MAICRRISWKLISSAPHFRSFSRLNVAESSVPEFEGKIYSPGKTMASYIHCPFQKPTLWLWLTLAHSITLTSQTPYWPNHWILFFTCHAALVPLCAGCRLGILGSPGSWRWRWQRWHWAVADRWEDTETQEVGSGGCDFLQPLHQNKEGYPKGQKDCSWAAELGGSSPGQRNSHQFHRGFEGPFTSEVVQTAGRKNQAHRPLWSRLWGVDLTRPLVLL